MKNVMPQELFLEGRSIVRIRDGKGIVLSVVHGTLWVTQEGDVRDIVLGHGGRLRIERDGLTLVHAMEPSRVVLGPHAAWPVEVGVPSFARMGAGTRRYAVAS